MPRELTLKQLSTEIQQYIKMVMDGLLDVDGASTKKQRLNEFYQLKEKNFDLEADLPSEYQHWVELQVLLTKSKTTPSQFVSGKEKTEFHADDIKLVYHFVHYLMIIKVINCFVEVEVEADTSVTLDFDSKWLEDKLAAIFKLFADDFTASGQQYQKLPYLYVLEEITLRGIKKKSTKPFLEKYLDCVKGFFNTLMNQLIPFDDKRVLLTIEFLPQIQRCMNLCALTDEAQFTDFMSFFSAALHKTTLVPFKGLWVQRLYQHQQRAKMLTTILALYDSMATLLPNSLMPWVVNEQATLEAVYKTFSAEVKREHKLNLVFPALLVVLSLLLLSMPVVFPKNIWIVTIACLVCGIFVLAGGIFAYLDEIELQTRMWLTDDHIKPELTKSFLEHAREKMLQLAFLNTETADVALKIKLITSDLGQQLIQSGSTTADELLTLPLDRLKVIISKSSVDLMKRLEINVADIQKWPTDVLVNLSTPVGITSLQGGLFFMDRRAVRDDAAITEFAFK